MKVYAVKKQWLVLTLALPVTTATAQTTGMDATTRLESTSSVAEVLHNSAAYLDQQFSIGKLPQKMIDSISHVDTGKPDFKRISIDFKEVYDKAGSAVPMAFEKSSTYVNEGHGIFKQYEALRTNGFESVASFSLTYRGLANLRWQTLTVNATAMPPIFQVADFGLSAPANAPHFGYAYELHGPTALSLKNSVECKTGAAYPASQINSDIKGMTHDVDCQILNANGIAIGTAEYSYLEQYGIAIQTHIKLTNSETSRTVVGFKAK